MDKENLKFEEMSAEFVEQLVLCSGYEDALDKVSDHYMAAISVIKSNMKHYAQHGTRENAINPAYPYLCLNITSSKRKISEPIAYGNIKSMGWYGVTVTQVDIFKAYLKDQLSRLDRHYEIVFYVGDSRTPIPLTFAIDPTDYTLNQEQVSDLANHFIMPELSEINDKLADGYSSSSSEYFKPLSLFTALRTDYSLLRLRHYTGTNPRDFQKFVIFTNYQRYVEEFEQYALSKIDNGTYEGFSAPGLGVVKSSDDYKSNPNRKLPQMPAYHLMGDNNEGISLVNIGVGPSNAKTITDHIAVLRPHCWLMLGHCGGLRSTQTLGDFVLAHAYMRDDQVLDEVLPTSIPLPTIAEVQIAITQAISDVMSMTGPEMKKHVRTGTVVTTADRNWEIRYGDLKTRINQSRAIAIDMESATIAANGYRFRVPYGTLLCVSDRPLHGEIKLPGAAEKFYRDRVSQHLEVGLQAIKMMKEAAQTGTLHSRKLRSLDEPAFR